MDTLNAASSSFFVRTCSREVTFTAQTVSWNAGSTLLKTPRTAIATFYVGTKPDAGGGSGSGGSEGGGGEAPDPAA